MSEIVAFRMARADWVALSTVVARRPLPLRLATIAITLSLMVFVMATLPARDPAAGSLLAEALRGGPDWYPLWGLAGLIAIGLFFRHRIVGLNAAAGFARMPLADRDLVVTMIDEEVRVGALGEPPFDWRFPWTAVARVVETPTHLVVAVGAREGLPLPRRAVTDADAWTRLVDFVRARLPEGAARESV